MKKVFLLFFLFSLRSLLSQIKPLVTDEEVRLFIDSVCQDEISFKKFRSFLLQEFNFCDDDRFILLKIPKKCWIFSRTTTSLYQSIVNHGFSCYDPAVKKVYLQLYDQEVFTRLKEAIRTSQSMQKKIYSLQNFYSISWSVCMLYLDHIGQLGLFTDLIFDLNKKSLDVRKWINFFSCYKNFINMPMFPCLSNENKWGDYRNYTAPDKGMVINTPLIVAVQRGDELFTEWLVNHQDIKLNERNSENKTVLMIAAYMNNYRFVHFLLKCGSNLLLDNCGNKAHDYATQDSVKNILQAWEFMEKEKLRLAHEDIPCNLSGHDIDDFIYGVLSIMAELPEEKRLRSLLTGSAYRCINRMQDLFNKVKNDAAFDYICQRIKKIIQDDEASDKLIETLHWFADNYVSDCM